MSLFAEVKRRNMVRVALAWLALSWMLVEIASILFPAYGFPTVVIRWLILGLILAFPLVLLVAWFLNLASKGQRLDQVIIVVILLALSVAALREFALPERVETPAPEPVAPAVEIATAPANPRSVAVLAFANLSPDHENEYLAEGVAEEVLNVLARVDGLIVASRTSSFSFRGQDISVREIGRQLGVAHVLDGSLRRQGDRVRISAQLVSTANDRQLWSDTFDRELTDIFAIQEEIAQAIANALAEHLGVRTVEVRRPTDDLEAYELYLRGRQLFAQRGASLQAARELLRRAVERDPRFAEAWAVLAGTEFVLPTYFSDEDTATVLMRAREAAARALALNPDHPEALAVSARVSAESGQRLQAMAQIDRALALDPNNANTWTWKGLTLLEAGHVAEARRCFERARALDPLSGIHHGWYGATALVDGDLATAEDSLRRAHALGWRGAASAWLLKAALLADRPGAEVEKRFNDWLHDDARIHVDARPVYRSVGPAFSDPAALGRARATLSDAAKMAPDHDWTHPMLFLGFHEMALAETLRPKPPSGQITLMMVWTQVDQAFREHPRFMEFAAAEGLPEFWREYGWPDYCVAAGGEPAHLECER